jgi:hypothetical protein
MHDTPKKNCGGSCELLTSTLLIADHTFPFHDSASGMSYPAATHALRETHETAHTAEPWFGLLADGWPMIVHA